jgi:hypothetical protein
VGEGVWVEDGVAVTLCVASPDADESAAPAECV